MINRYVLTDFAGNPVEAWPPTMDLPFGTTPDTYKHGVYVFGYGFWCAKEIGRMPPDCRREILKAPHQLFYGYRDSMLYPGAREIVLSVEGVVRAVQRALAA